MLLGICLMMVHLPRAKPFSLIGSLMGETSVAFASYVQSLKLIAFCYLLHPPFSSEKLNFFLLVICLMMAHAWFHLPRTKSFSDWLIIGKTFVALSPVVYQLN